MFMISGLDRFNHKSVGDRYENTERRSISELFKQYEKKTDGSIGFGSFI